ncbi:hypothetical protein VSU01S_07300 [Vibrio superstes NBRC 103154]|uniref:Uncharacterized protein n=1 Tax=Vibrio superstes NBRC 103154 TaxID=1219062 RepID=A0A511QMC9_9VIBR|nr:hypothetical protein VSU01S_07300 [Vibrio superstes NBRC 103154]
MPGLVLTTLSTWGHSSKWGIVKALSLALKEEQPKINVAEITLESKFIFVFIVGLVIEVNDIRRTK